MVDEKEKLIRIWNRIFEKLTKEQLLAVIRLLEELIRLKM